MELINLDICVFLEVKLGIKEDIWVSLWILIGML